MVGVEEGSGVVEVGRVVGGATDGMVVVRGE